jgi:regulatory protein YycH of two-component signal transduction system YycFG
MNKETIKSATLTVLIAISLFFTWSMWNLQPSYEEFQNQTLIESIPIDDDTKVTYEVIKPQHLFFHSFENHYSSIDAKYLNSLWKEMQGWEFSNVKSQSPFLTRDEFQKWMSGNNEAKLELKFYNEIPMATFQSMLQWDSDTNENITFDRIYLNVMKDNDVQQKVYFVSYDKMIVVETSVNDLDAKNFVASLFDKRKEFQSYFSFDTGQGNEIMLPENEVTIGSYQYFTEIIEGEKFKDALFSNPQIVKQDANISKDRYTDGTRELNIFPNQHMVKYVNPTLRDKDSVHAKLLIDQSISFINDHGGWTDNYVLFDVNENDQEIEFIMSIQSIPVINSMGNPFGPTIITQRWGQNEIAIYQRPSYQLLAPPISSKITTLISGNKLVELITNNQQIDKTNIHNIFIAYELGSSESQQFVKVSPVWCIEMKDGTLMKINDDLDQSGGNKNGVE